MSEAHTHSAIGGVTAIGELLIDFVAQESGVSVGEASGFIKAPGGAPANVAAAVAKLGAPAAFLTQVGDDPFGHHLIAVLKAIGVDTDGIRLATAARTMLAFVSLGADGERSFAFYRHPSADMLYRPEDVDVRKIEASAILHFGSVTLIDDPLRAATLFAADTARRLGKLVSYDPNLRPALWPSLDAAKDGIFAGLVYAHLVKVSEEELDFLTGGSVDALWARFPDLKLIIVTKGAGGAAAYQRDQAVVAVPGFPITAVDTTGAGDAFVAGLLVKLLEAGGIEAAAPHLDAIVRFANAVGAITCMGKGAIPSLPTRAQVEEFLHQHT